MDDKKDEEAHMAVRSHVRSILDRLKAKIRSTRNATDHTVEVDREKKRPRSLYRQ